jgi:2,3-bisphosphoglycerate-dependent phosphoglycerate mutase
VQAQRCGETLARADLLPDVAHTSVLSRAVSTTEIVCPASGRGSVEIHTSWRLNERHYGALQGRNKEQTREEFGDAQFTTWRRGFSTRPPAIEPSSTFSQADDSRYRDLGITPPVTESLADVLERLLPYWHSAIVPDLRSGNTVLVVAHSNSLRALIKHLDAISDSDIVTLNISTGAPLRYEFDDDLNPVTPGGEPVKG